MANEETKAPVKKTVKTEVLDMITSDGTDKKQGEKVVKEAFGVVIETNY